MVSLEKFSHTQKILAHRTFFNEQNRAKMFSCLVNFALCMHCCKAISVSNFATKTAAFF